jgi:hypothetical protein
MREALPDPLGSTGAALGCLGFPALAVTSGLTVPPGGQTARLCATSSA